MDPSTQCFHFRQSTRCHSIPRDLGGALSCTCNRPPYSRQSSAPPAAPRKRPTTIEPFRTVSSRSSSRRRPLRFSRREVSSERRERDCAAQPGQWGAVRNQRIQATRERCMSLPPTALQSLPGIFGCQAADALVVTPTERRCRPFLRILLSSSRSHHWLSRGSFRSEVVLVDWQHKYS